MSSDGYCTPCGECRDCQKVGADRRALRQARRRIKSLVACLTKALSTLEQTEEDWRSLAERGQKCEEADFCRPAIRSIRRVLK